MDYKKKTKEQLIKELKNAKKRIIELEEKDDSFWEEENKFKQIAENLKEVFWLRTEDKYLYISPAFEKLWGISSEILYDNSTSNFDFLHPEDKKRLLEKYNIDKFHTQEVFNEEYRIIRPDGEIRWISTHSFPIQSKTGKIKKRAGICEDITKRKQYELVLEENEERFFQILHQMPYPIEVLDEYGTAIMFNKAFMSFYKISSVDIVLGKFNVFKENIIKKIGLFKHYKKVFKGITVNIPEFKLPIKIVNAEIADSKYKIKREKEVILEITMFPVFNKKGNIWRVVSIGKDISEQKKIEDKNKELSFAIEQSIDGIAICSLKQELIYVNNAFAKMHGYSPENIIGMNVAKLHSKKQTAAVKNNMSYLIENGIWEGEVGHMKKDGTEFPTFMTGSLLKDNNGKLTGVLAIMRDISRIKQTQKELEQKNFALREILTQIEIEKNEMKKNIRENIESLVMPYLNELKYGINNSQKQLVELIENNLKDITYPFLKRISNNYVKLSLREIEICNMVINGLSNKEIAEILTLSYLTIEKHRQRIRKKLGIINKNINLVTYLKHINSK